MAFYDPEVASLVTAEEERQRTTFTLIPSENYASSSVRAALASSFTNKYSEGYPGARYYGGQEMVDALERLAQKRALDMMLSPDMHEYWRANVQPYSGTPANLAALLALAGPGGKIMGLELSHGGHLTHGHHVSATGILFEAHKYKVDPVTQKIDMNSIADMARKVRPKVIISGTTAYPRTLDFEAFGSIAKEIGAIHLSDISHIAGLVVGNVHPSPFHHAEVVMSTIHKTLRGPRGAVLWSHKEYARAIDKMVFPGTQGGPHESSVAAAAVCFAEAKSEAFQQYARTVVKNAKTLADALLERGFTLVTGGTDNHLMVLDLRSKEILGADAEEVLERAGIIANKNTVPGDPNPPSKPSGLRLGTPAITTRGLQPEHMATIAEWITRVLDNRNDETTVTAVRHEVQELACAYPPPSSPFVEEKPCACEHYEDPVRQTGSATH